MTERKELYVIGAEGLRSIKIGISADPVGRCRDLQVGNPFDLRVLHRQAVDDALVLEGAIHRVLREHKVRGEWFAIDYESAVAAIAEALLIVDDAGDAAIPWLAEPGECPSCDRRRAAGVAANKAARARRAAAGTFDRTSYQRELMRKRRAEDRERRTKQKEITDDR